MLEALRAALRWWDEEAQHLTEGDYGEHNVFYDEPEWVHMARKAIAVPVPTTPPSPSDKVLLNTQLISLTQGDVDILDGSKNRKVRIDPYEDEEVKALYAIWKSL